MQNIHTHRYHRVPRFQSEDANAVEYLKENGYVVFASVLSAQECEEVLDLIFQWLGQATNGLVEQGDPSTFHHWPPCIGQAPDTGILPYNGIGQSEAQWRVRESSHVRQAFSSIWGTEDLITSFDAICLFRPWKHDLSWKTKGGWFHVDQHPKFRLGFESVQGLVNLLPMNENSGGNVLIPKSHLQFGEWLRRYPAEVATVDQGEDLFNIPQDDIVLTNPQHISRIHLEVGDLLCWDSRTIHCSAPSLTGESVSKRHELVRAVSFVCMSPRTKASEEVIKARKHAVADQVSTAHRPHLFQPTHEYNDWRLKKAQGALCHYPPAPAKMNRIRWRLVGCAAPENSKAATFEGKKRSNDATHQPEGKSRRRDAD